MTALPTYVYLGDEQITGGDVGVKPSSELPVAWGAGRLLTTFHRYVPAAGSAYAPYWDGFAGTTETSTAATGTTITRAGAGYVVNALAGLRIHIDSGPGSGDLRTILSNTADTITVDAAWTANPTASNYHVGTGLFLKFWHMNSYAPNPALMPGSRGDNWFELGGGITPASMLMQSLGDQYGSAAPGFRFVKLAQVHGAAGWKPGGVAYEQFASNVWARAVAAAEADGDTLDVRAVIWDGSTRDIAAGNLDYADDLQAMVDGFHDLFGPDVLVVIVNQNASLYRTSLPGVALAARHENRVLMANNPTVRLFDMNWGGLAPSAPLQPEPADPVYYDTETYLQAGVGLFRTIRAYYTPQPVVAPGAGVAVVHMLGDSQMVTGPSSPLLLVYSDEASKIGEGPGTILPGVWVYNWQNDMVEPFDALTNSNSLPDVFGFYGPDVMTVSRLRARFPDGVVLFKWAKPTRSVTYEAVAAGAVQAFEKDAPGSAYAEIAAGWEKARVAIMRDLGRTPDTVGILVTIENDAASDAAVAAFATKAPQFVDDYRLLLGTRTTGEPTPFVWLQPPPPIETTAGGSVLHTTARREAVRATIAGLATSKPRFAVRLNTGQYELTRTDRTHYGGTAILDIGEDLAVDLVALIDWTEAAECEAPEAEEAEPPPAATSPQDILNILDAAIASGGDVASYSLNGRTVQLRGMADLLAARRYYASVVSQSHGLRRTRVGWRR